MERPWIYAVVGAAALFAAVMFLRQPSSDPDGSLSDRDMRVARLHERERPESGDWNAPPGAPGRDAAGGGSSSSGSVFERRGGGAGGSARDAGGTAVPGRGASVFVDRGRSGFGGGRSGFHATTSGGGPGGGGEAIQAGSGIEASDVPFEGARPITGPISGRAPDGSSSEGVAGVATSDESKPPPPEDGGPVLSLPFDKSTEPDRGDTAVFEQGVTFDSGDGAVFSTDSQFVVPNGGNLNGESGSISMWVQPGWAGGDDSNASLVQLRNQNQWEDRLQIFKNGRYMRFLLTDSTGQESNIGATIDDWAPGDWHNLVATWGQNDNGQLVQSFYIDGKLIGQVPVQNQFNVRAGTPLYIGSDLPLGIPGANGAISQFQAYNRALAPDEVANSAANRPR